MNKIYFNILTIYIALLLFVNIIIVIIIPHVYSHPFEIDVTAKVYKVIDGDTFDAFPIGRVRLADINTPERWEAFYHEAKEALTKLILNKKVYLDIDDQYVMDSYNRLVAVVYIRHNKTHLLNVNYWLVHNGYAVIKDYENEFNPNTWRAFEYYPEELEEITKTYTPPQKTITEMINATQPQIIGIKEITPSSYLIVGLIVGIILGIMLTRKLGFTRK
ncbi:MAG: thermonuclease family protein [Nitrososphaerales archaeon]